MQDQATAHIVGNSAAHGRREGRMYIGIGTLIVIVIIILIVL